MEDDQKLAPGASTDSTDSVTSTKDVTKEGITLRSRSVKRLVTVSPKKGKLTKNTETVDTRDSMDTIESDKTGEVHVDSKESSIECEQDLVKEKEKNKRETSMTEDFVIVIEPEKNTASSSTAPTASTSKDLTHESTDLSTKAIDLSDEKMKDEGLKIKSVYSLRNRSNRINWSHALADSSDMLDDDIDSEEMENTKEAMDLQVVQPVVIEPVPEMITPPVADLRTAPKPLEIFRTESRRLYPQSHDAGRKQRRSMHYDADDVIVIEDVPEVAWVEHGHVILPEHHGKVKATGGRKLGTLRALLAYFAKMAPPARRLFSCTKCRMGFSVHADWLKHRQECDVTEVTEGSLIYYCNRCPSSFARHRDWVAHRKSHTVVTPKWMCDRCFKKFTSRRDLRDHRLYCRGRVEAPASTKPQFQCKVCDKSFPYPSALKVHNETHVLKHKCPICDIPFTRFYEMTKHVRADHPDVETHPCEHCGKVFDRLTMLYRHLSDGECPMFNNQQITVIS